MSVGGTFINRAKKLSGVIKEDLLSFDRLLSSYPQDHHTSFASTTGVYIRLILCKIFILCLGALSVSLSNFYQLIKEIESLASREMLLDKRQQYKE